MSKQAHLIPNLRKKSMVMFVAGAGISITSDLLRFVAEVSKEGNSNTIEILGASLSACATVAACGLLLLTKIGSAKTQSSYK